MNKKKTLLILILVLVLLLGGAYVLYSQLGQGLAGDRLEVQGTEPPQSSGDETGDVQESEPAQQESEKISAPDFTVYDGEGNEVHLSDFAGKPVILNFWASWCGPCRSEMPDFNEKHLELGEDIAFLMINMTDGARETVDSASKFISEQGYVFPVFYDTQSEAAMAYGAYSLPTTYFIDADGFAVARAIGAIDGETLQRGIDLIAP